MLSISDKKQANVIEAFISTSRYLDELLYIDNPYFEQLVSQIYPAKHQLNEAKSDTEAPFFTCFLFVLFDLILYVPSTIFQLYRDGSFWVEPV